MRRLFGLYMPTQAPDQGDVVYEPLYALAPRAQDPLADAQIPMDQQVAFEAGWLPAHHTVIQVPLASLPGSGGVDLAVHTILPGPVNMKAEHSNHAYAVYSVSDIDFPCHPRQQAGVRVTESELAQIPIVLKAAPSMEMQSWLQNADPRNGRPPWTRAS